MIHRAIWNPSTNKINKPKRDTPRTKDLRKRFGKLRIQDTPTATEEGRRRTRSRSNDASQLREQSKERPAAKKKN